MNTINSQDDVTMENNSRFPTWCISLPFRMNVELEAQETTQEYGGEYIPAQLPGFELYTIIGGKIAPDSIKIAHYDESGKPVVYDPALSGEEAFRIPHRFDPDYNGLALPDDPGKGTLVFLARSFPRRQRYSIYFALETAVSKQNEEYHGLIGDGDIFTQKQGRMSVPGFSRPVYYGKGLFGRQGLLVASGYEMGIYFFEEIENCKPNGPHFSMCGRLLDSEGKVIFGIPSVHDVNGDGKIDLVIGRPDGTIVWHENLGTNEKPVFSPVRPFTDEKGQPIDLKPYLLDKEIVVRRADGTVNPHYPKMNIFQKHGGRLHINTVLMFIENGQNGYHDLLVGTTGGYYLYFKHTGQGYAAGEFVRDAMGNVVSGDVYFASSVPRAEKRLPDIVAGNIFGQLTYIFTEEGAHGEPVFMKQSPLTIPSEGYYSFPLMIRIQGEEHLLVGNYYGEIRLYKIVGRDADQTLLLDQGRYLETSNAWITRYMPTCNYADFDGDGRKDLLSGDISGRLFFYKNIGTDKNPLFDCAYQLSDENGPIKIDGGPDPNMPDDGYSKPTPMDMNGRGMPDLLVGSGLGRIFHYEHTGLDSGGKPQFRNMGVLRDTEGNEVRCHHMSAVAFGDLNNDGVPDLIVSGGRNIHNCPDDDFDNASQVRWYQGVKEGNSLRFLPYVPMDAEGDRECGIRPIPPLLDASRKELEIYIGIRIHRQTDPSRPQSMELVRVFPPRLARGWENIIVAYFTLSSLGENDPLVVQGSCVGSLFAFRKSFVINKGYLRTTGSTAHIESAEGSLYEHARRFISGIVRPPVLPVITRSHSIPRIAAGNGGGILRDEEWAVVTADKSFKDSLGQVMDVSLSPSVKVAYNDRFLLLNGYFPEPLMSHLINRAQHRNGAVEFDDFIGVFLDTGRHAGRYFGWFITALGFYKEAQFEHETNEWIGPWRVGGPEPVMVKTLKLETGYHVQLAVPFAKLGGKPADDERWFLDIRRNRALYANEIRAPEQRLSERFCWSGKSNGWVRLDFKNKWRL